MNRGDATSLVLNITINGEAITQDYADEIELTFNPEQCSCSVRKTLSDGEITWNDLEDKYLCRLNQADTFKFKAGTNSWQLRILKDNDVVSTDIGQLIVGEANSKVVLTNEQS